MGTRENAPNRKEKRDVALCRCLQRGDVASFVNSFLFRLLLALLDSRPLVSQGFLSIGRRGVQSLGAAVNPPFLDPPADSREPRPLSRAE
ncbi:hypothetical protein E2C01_100256 [Portunus trituberculatus]|uniref:Uncharacterized protein n=1 Tax=Portunus trituberculatus TaxID=210409 RepID=A0A5B7K2K0_PORTR|nr:hypothetical protein [Portunus trituberculatus]